MVFRNPHGTRWSERLNVNCIQTYSHRLHVDSFRLLLSIVPFIDILVHEDSHEAFSLPQSTHNSCALPFRAYENRSTAQPIPCHDPHLCNTIFSSPTHLQQYNQCRLRRSGEKSLTKPWSDGRQTMRHKWHVNVNECDKMHFELWLSVRRVSWSWSWRPFVFSMREMRNGAENGVERLVFFCFCFGAVSNCSKSESIGHALNPIKQITGLFVHRRWARRSTATDSSRFWQKEEIECKCVQAHTKISFN